MLETLTRDLPVREQATRQQPTSPQHTGHQHGHERTMAQHSAQDSAQDSAQHSAQHPVVVRRPRTPQPALLQRSAPAAPAARPETMPRTSAYGRGLRLTRRGRLVVLGTALVLLFLAFSIGRVVSNAAPAGPAKATTHTVVVAPGDTAWSIARAAMPRLDGRDAVDRLLALNHSDGRLRVGQTLVVPGS